MKHQENNLTIFIAAHKDFVEQVKNPSYKIVADDNKAVKNNYNLEVIFTDKDNELYPLKNTYAEGSKIFWVWKNYLPRINKYVGFCHYRRVFSFKNRVPNMDLIFQEFDAIINKKETISKPHFDFYSNSTPHNLNKNKLKIIKEIF